MLKYHLFEKRDGAIVNAILDADGSLISDPNQVARNLLQTLEEIQVDPVFSFIEKKKFPKLPLLSRDEMARIMSLLSTNKAIAFDAIHDLIFKPSNDSDSLFQAAASKLGDLWSVDLDDLLTDEDTWATRLMALNKVFPELPDRKQFRAICIQSALVNLLEARFLPKLQHYLITRSIPSQTGFVPTMEGKRNPQRRDSTVILNIKV